MGAVSSFVIRCCNKILRTNMPFNRFFHKRAVRSVLKREFDFVVVENYPELVLELKEQRAVPYIHSDILNAETDNAREIVEKSYKIITVSDFIRRRVLEAGGLTDGAARGSRASLGGKVVAVHNSINDEFISKGDYAKYRKFYRKKYGLGDGKVFVYLGRVSPEKGVLELVEAFRAAGFGGANDKSAKLLVVGGAWYGSRKVSPYLRNVMAAAEESVVFTGYVDHDEIGKLLCCGDVGVVPSTCNEAAGLIVTEFLRARMSTITSDRGGIGEYAFADNKVVKYAGREEFVRDLSKAIKAAEVEKRDARMVEKAHDFSLAFNPRENYYGIIRALHGEK
jgi:glycosyltransferase involved in cell wall biosynthesis